MADELFFLIASDSHRHPNALIQVWKRQIRTPDALLFLGDGLSDLFAFSAEFPYVTVYAVSGNCDFHRLLPDGSLAPEERCHRLGGLSVWMTHGHRFGVKGGTGALVREAERERADIVLYGHTHRQNEFRLQRQDGGSVWLCNPGSIGDDGSFATLTIRDGVPLIGLGKL